MHYQINSSTGSVSVHKALYVVDRTEPSISRIQSDLHRRRWLCSNQKLLRAFTSYCTLHNSQNHRLTSALMELLLLLMEVQQDGGSSTPFSVVDYGCQLIYDCRCDNLSLDSLPVAHPFPLFIASVSPYKMFVSSPLSFVKTLCSDILLSLTDISEPPLIECSLTKVGLNFFS
ncbi:unnamed protein product [Gongylonema pulchrum]|uniref:Uncharacterized protein n=1 Tax=Gongylonema pulchrum TaxID=637853 RepID=A0A3P7MN28_9BILA|nr:unnamed protein product [Gongylonema pulchrum]